MDTVDQTGTWNQTFNYDRSGNRKFDEANTSMPNSLANPPVTNPTISPNSNGSHVLGQLFGLSVHLFPEIVG